jgi:hypothetical protein
LDRACQALQNKIKCKSVGWSWKSRFFFRLGPLRVCFSYHWKWTACRRRPRMLRRLSPSSPCRRRLSRTCCRGSGWTCRRRDGFRRDRLLRAETRVRAVRRLAACRADQRGRRRRLRLEFMNKFKFWFIKDLNNLYWLTYDYNLLNLCILIFDQELDRFAQVALLWTVDFEVEGADDCYEILKNWKQKRII